MMEEVVRIAPLQNDPGLIAYECPSCGYVTSFFWLHKTPRQNNSALLLFRLAMALKLRPTGLGSGIDKDRQDYTVYTGGWGVLATSTRLGAVLSIFVGFGLSPSMVR